MSIIALLFKWIKLPTWAKELLAIGIAGGIVWLGVLWWEHKEIDIGIARQQAADAAEVTKLKAEVAIETAAKTKKAQDAEAMYAKEHEDFVEYQTQHPITGAPELCHDTYSSHKPMSTGSPSHAGDAAQPATPSVGSPVHAGDSPGPDDRSRLLGAIAALLDDQSAIIREYQQR